jgi:hypothetical protein
LIETEFFLERADEILYFFWATLASSGPILNTFPYDLHLSTIFEELAKGKNNEE